MKIKIIKRQLLIIGILFISISFLKAQGYDCYKIGDVIYSVLDTTAFYKIHDHKWQLLSGQDMSNTDLFWRRAIDARGLFIKGVTDPLGDNGIVSYNFANYQTDALPSHDHFVSVEVNGTRGTQIPFSDDVSYQPPVFINQYSPTSPLFTSSYGGTETRPRNISLYIYVKVNE